MCDKNVNNYFLIFLWKISVQFLTGVDHLGEWDQNVVYLGVYSFISVDECSFHQEYSLNE